MRHKDNGEIPNKMSECDLKKTKNKDNISTFKKLKQSSIKKQPTKIGNVLILELKNK